MTTTTATTTATKTTTMSEGGAAEASADVGLLIVGLGGANGTTLLAGVLANRLDLQWYGPQGQRMSPNYYGCITQLDQRGVHGGVGYRDRLRGLADASKAAIGGWDIRPTKLGDALFEAQILDYDLVRQVRREMNGVPVLPGLYDPRFIGSSQHGTATHVLAEEGAGAALEHLRNDIREFKLQNGLKRSGEESDERGHTTVIWSASVEPNCDLLESLKTADDLMNAIGKTEKERGGPLPPSLLYATAAVLEGCSFINGGSQNTLSCPGLIDLASKWTGVYCLGTDFKAGQTKFKTAAVEYLRTMGLTPRVVASSNHLGNNDMRNLASSKTTSTAKLRVKHDIFAPWQEEDLDHKVSIMFTEFINDEKRDFVEYTSLGFLGQVHTMVTYTRASDSVLCVPLMLDGAVWCDFFNGRQWPYDKVAKALAYLFKVPEGSAKGVDPGFFRQMRELETQVLEADKAEIDPSRAKLSSSSKAKGASIEWMIPNESGILCAGLGCVDMQLLHATGGEGGESIESFEGEKSMGGGSVAMACKTLARLHYGGNISSRSVVKTIVPICKVGSDSTGDKLISLLADCGRNVETKHIQVSRAKYPGARTALSVLPIYQNGTRGCFFDAASNQYFTSKEIIDMAECASSPSSSSNKYGACIFGYPHLIPLLQGKELANFFSGIRRSMADGGITVLDLNGVPESTFIVDDTGVRSIESLKSDSVIGAALDGVDILHMNEEELGRLTGFKILGTPEDDTTIVSGANLFLSCGVGIVAVTRGSRGSVVCCNTKERFSKSISLPATWAGCCAKVRCAKLPENTKINSNGAGDAFTSGLLVATMLRCSSGDNLNSLTLEQAVRFAGTVAAYHIDIARRDLSHVDISELLENALTST